MSRMLSDIGLTVCCVIGAAVGGKEAPAFEFTGTTKVARTHMCNLVTRALQEVDTDALLSSASDNGYKWVKSPHPRKPKAKVFQHERKLIGQCSVGARSGQAQAPEDYRPSAAHDTGGSGRRHCARWQAHGQNRIQVGR